MTNEAQAQAGEMEEAGVRMLGEIRETLQSFYGEQRATNMLLIALISIVGSEAIAQCKKRGDTETAALVQRVLETAVRKP